VRDQAVKFDVSHERNREVSRIDSQLQGDSNLLATLVFRKWFWNHLACTCTCFELIVRIVRVATEDLFITPLLGQYKMNQWQVVNLFGLDFANDSKMIVNISDSTACTHRFSVGIGSKRWRVTRSCYLSLQLLVCQQDLLILCNSTRLIILIGKRDESSIWVLDADGLESGPLGEYARLDQIQLYFLLNRIVSQLIATKEPCLSGCLTTHAERKHISILVSGSWFH